MQNLMKTLIVAGVSLALCAGAAIARESYSWTKFKGNLDANGIDELIRSTVFVGYFQDQNRPDIAQRDSVIINVTDEQGKAHDCSWWNGQDTFKYSGYIKRGGTFTQANRIRLDRMGVAEVGARADNGGSIPVYDGTNGSFQTFIFHKRRWWENRTGHLQRAIPAATWELCPEFPSAASLGLAVNPHQTAARYKEMMKQHPGIRILRPDLITEDTKVTWERGEPEPPLTRGYWNAFSEHPCFGCNK